MTMATVEFDPTRKKTPHVVRWRDEQGKQRKKGFPRKLDAKNYRTEIEHQLNTGTYTDPKAGRITFEVYAEQWRAIQPHRPNTAARTKSQLTKHVYPVLGARPIGQLRHSELQAFVNGLPVSASSVRPIWATVRAILRTAVVDRLITFDPCAKVQLPELPIREHNFVRLTVDQVDAVTEAMPPRYRALVVVGAMSGLRQGELFGLEVGDIEFLHRPPRVNVCRQVQPATGGGTELCRLKNRHSYRKVPVGKEAIEVLAAHLAAFPPGDGVEMLDTTGPRPVTRSARLMFTDGDDRALHRNRFNKYVWDPARKAAGLPGEATMHDLRHFYASALIFKGRSANTVAARLGHADPTTTWKFYAGLWPDEEELSAQDVDDTFAEARAARASRVPTVCPSDGA
ncbi:tyrosine-type recombinase/integrase [Micromonospora chersina]|uniref:tyrosine-type recombinase/integrase n=1 Tax=Micromonospora chersina TaxID=47854 RepID=UPI00371A0869